MPSRQPVTTLQGADEADAEPLLWDGRVHTVAQPAVPKSRYQTQLEQGASLDAVGRADGRQRRLVLRAAMRGMWRRTCGSGRTICAHTCIPDPRVSCQGTRHLQRGTDPPASVCDVLLRRYCHGDEHEPFSLSVLGSEAARRMRDDIDDRLHFFMEDCDSPQGFHVRGGASSHKTNITQVLCDLDDGFVGLGSGLSTDMTVHTRWLTGCAVRAAGGAAGRVSEENDLHLWGTASRAQHGIAHRQRRACLQLRRCHGDRPCCLQDG